MRIRGDRGYSASSRILFHQTLYQEPFIIDIFYTFNRVFDNRALRCKKYEWKIEYLD